MSTVWNNQITAIKQNMHWQQWFRRSSKTEIQVQKLEIVRIMEIRLVGERCIAQQVEKLHEVRRIQRMRSGAGQYPEKYDKVNTRTWRHARRYPIDAHTGLRTQDMETQGGGNMDPTTHDSGPLGSYPMRGSVGSRDVPIAIWWE